MKHFLETNKIYFETLAAVLLGIMAIVVSISQAWLAHKSYELSKLKYLPEIAANVTMGGKRCGAGSWKLTTSNISGNAYNVDVRAIAFLSMRELQLLKPGQKLNRSVHLKRALVPLRGYFSPVSYGTGATNGKLVVQCTQPLDAMDGSTQDFEHLYAPKGERSITSSTVIYMAVSYKSRFMDEQTRYFRINSGGQAVPISVGSGNEVFNNYTIMAAKGQYLEYGASTGQDIMHVWKKNAS